MAIQAIYLRYRNVAHPPVLLVVAALAVLGAAPSRPPPVVTGVASYYGAWHAGRVMANGCRFNPNKPTAASKTLRLGTLIRVRSLRNGLSITVRITDRGPYVKGRTLDLSLAAARAIDAVQSGVVPVSIEILGMTPERRCS